MLLVLLTRILLWASVGLLIWYLLTKVIDQKYLTWFGGVILVILLGASFAAPDDGTIQIIWRILSFPLTPLGAAIVFLAISLSDGIGKVKGNPAAIALTILLISSIPISAQWLVGQAEQSVRTAYQQRAAICDEVCRDTTIAEQGDLGEAAAIVVVGDRSELAVSNASVDNASINTVFAPRLIYAANLYRQSRNLGAAPTVFVTAGIGGNSQAATNQSQLIRDILISNGVLPGDIQVENTNYNVRETAGEVEDFLQDNRIISAREARRTQGTDDDPRVVIVAPAIIMSRAALTFEEMDLEVVAKPTDFRTASFSNSGDILERLPDLLPSVEALELTTRYWNELLNSLYYFLRGWLPDFNFGWDSNIEI